MLATGPLLKNITFSRKSVIIMPCLRNYCPSIKMALAGNNFDMALNKENKEKQ